MRKGRSFSMDKLIVILPEGANPLVKEALRSHVLQSCRAVVTGHGCELMIYDNENEFETKKNPMLHREDTVYTKQFSEDDPRELHVD